MPSKNVSNLDGTAESCANAKTIQQQNDRKTHFLDQEPSRKNDTAVSPLSSHAVNQVLFRALMMQFDNPPLCHSDKERSHEESAIGRQLCDAIQETQIPPLRYPNRRMTNRLITF